MPRDVVTNGGRRHPASEALSERLTALAELDAASLRAEWRRLYRSHPPKRAGRDLLARAIAQKLQERALGGLSDATKRKLRDFAEQLESGDGTVFDPGIALKPGAKLLREWGGNSYVVIALEEGFEFNGRRYRSLSKIAREITGAHWSGPRFFNLKRKPQPFAEQAVGTGHE
jgi:hypothetical protein